MGGSVTDSGLPTTLHMHYVGRTTTSCWLHHASCWLHCANYCLHNAHCVSHTEYDKKHLVNIKFKFWHFQGWRNKFFQNCSKLPTNHFRTIEILFFPDFSRLQVWVGGSDKIWKIPDFFKSFPNQSLKKSINQLPFTIRVKVCQCKPYFNTYFTNFWS